jgi:aspartyl-tRNA(Asn)/glutamyl-tRNA(Gln) amidotransferase subunit C
MKMKITAKEAERVAELGRLKFSSGELETLAAEMSNILDYVEKLGELDLEGVEPMSHVFGVMQTRREREDEVKPGLSNEEALANAPWPEEGCYRVAKVIEEGSGA